MGFLRWLSLIERFQMPQCVQFRWREAQSPTVLPDFARPCLVEFAFRNISDVHKFGPLVVSLFDQCSRCRIHSLFCTQHLRG